MKCEIPRNEQMFLSKLHFFKKILFDSFDEVLMDIDFKIGDLCIVLAL